MLLLLSLSLACLNPLAVSPAQHRPDNPGGTQQDGRKGVLWRCKSGWGDSYMAKAVTVEIPGLKLRSRCRCEKLGMVAHICYSRQEREWSSSDGDEGGRDWQIPGAWGSPRTVNLGLQIQ